MIKTRPSADKTRKVILKAAEKLFAQKGFSGASISEIAKNAKINQSLIYHHFRNKEGLWKEVKLAISARYYETYNPVDLATKQDLKKFLRHFVNNRFAYLQKNPCVLRILLWQRLESKKKQLHIGITKYHQQWYEAIRIMQQQKKISADLEPNMVTLFIFTTMLGVFEESSIVFQENKAQQQQEYLDFIVDKLYISLTV